MELQSGAASVCEHCQVRFRIKDIRKRRLDAVFGRVTVSCRRFIRCTCRDGAPHSIWPLASWGLLGLKRRHTLAVGALLDQRILEPDEYASFVPARPVTPPARAANRLMIAIDGTYVRSDLTNGLYQHYVVAGRIDHEGCLGGRFAYVAHGPTARRRVGFSGKDSKPRRVPERSRLVSYQHATSVD